MDLEAIRREYLTSGLRRHALSSDPIVQFEAWMQDAIGAGFKDPTAMTLATVDAKGYPSQRIVLLKHVDQAGFVFFTNYTSNKARDIAEHAHVSLHFPWHGLERQVKILGVARKVSADESLSYFTSRPRASQLAAWSSRQSRPIDSRAVLLEKFENLKRKFAQGEVATPDFWGGYRVEPQMVEFWQGRENRLHDRFEYRKQDETWVIDRLAP